MSNRTSHCVGIGLSVVLAAVCSASPAAAAQTFGFDIRTNAIGPDGYAAAWGSITYLDRHSVRIVSTVSDRCGAGSGDGEGAYLWAEVTYMDGTMDGAEALSLNWDNNGCGNGNSIQRLVTLNPGKNVRKVRVRLEEADGPSDPSEWDYSTWKDNPYTG